MLPLGLMATQLAQRDLGFYVVSPRGANIYDTVTATYPAVNNVSYGYGEMFTPSGNAMIGLSYFIYPITGAQGVYHLISIDGGPPHFCGYTYLGGAGWTEHFSFITIFPDLDKKKKHTFQWQISRSAYSAYVYHGATYESSFWGMDFPAKVFFDKTPLYLVPT